MDERSRLEEMISTSARASYNKVLNDVIKELTLEVQRYPLNSDEAEKSGFRGDPEKLFYKIVGLNRAIEIVNGMVIENSSPFTKVDYSDAHWR